MDGDESPPYDDGDTELDEGWIAYLTCYSYDNSQDQSAETQSAQNQPAQNQPAQNQPAQNQPAQDQPAQDQPAQDDGQVTAKVNINTASDIVLIALLGGTDEAGPAGA